MAVFLYPLICFGTVFQWPVGSVWVRYQGCGSFLWSATILCAQDWICYSRLVVKSLESSSSSGCGTYMAGMVNSVPRLKVGRKSACFPSHFWWPDAPKMHQIAQICTYIFKNFPGVIPLDPQPPQLLPRALSHFFRASGAAEYKYKSESTMVRVQGSSVEVQVLRNLKYWYSYASQN